MLRHLFSAPLSKWEECLVCMAYLDGIKLEDAAFLPEVAQRLRKAWCELCRLPPLLASELSLEVLSIYSHEV